MVYGNCLQATAMTKQNINWSFSTFSTFLVIHSEFDLHWHENSSRRFHFGRSTLDAQRWVPLLLISQYIMNMMTHSVVQFCRCLRQWNTNSIDLIRSLQTASFIFLYLIHLADITLWWQLLVSSTSSSRYCLFLLLWWPNRLYVDAAAITVMRSLCHILREYIQLRFVSGD